MESNQRTAPNFLHKGQGKDTHFQTQIKLVFVALSPAIVEPSKPKGNE